MVNLRLLTQHMYSLSTEAVLDVDEKHPSAYAGHIEMAAANHLYGINVYKVAGSPLPAIPSQNRNE